MSISDNMELKLIKGTENSHSLTETRTYVTKQQRHFKLCPVWFLLEKTETETKIYWKQNLK